MGRTTYRVFLFASFCLPLLLIGLKLRGTEFRSQLRPDTQSYVLSSPYRTSVYPSVLNLLMDEDLQRAAVLKGNPVPFSTVAGFQKTVFLLSLLILFVVCHRLISFAHLALCFFSFACFGSLFRSSLELLGWIQPEGLFLPWALILISLTLFLLQSKKTAPAILLSAWIFLGMWLTPRLICFAPFGLLPVFLLKRPVQKFTPMLLLLSLLFVRCLYVNQTTGVLALSPMNGIYTIGNVLRLADSSAVDTVKDPKARSFLAQSLRSRDRQTAMKFNDWMTWDFATRRYRDTFPEKFNGLAKGKDVIHMNRFYSQFFPVLFLKNASFRDAWMSSAGGQLMDYYRSSWSIEALYFLLFVGGTAAFIMTTQTVLIIPMICYGTHLLNLMITVTFSGMVGRYTLSSQTLIILSFFSVLLFLWDRFAAVLLNHFFSFNRRSITLENSSKG